MTDVRWLALLPDSMSGQDTPIVGDNGKAREWLAPDKPTALALIKASVTPNQFRLALVLSVLEYEAAQAEVAGKKAAAEKATFYRHAQRSKKR